MNEGAIKELVESMLAGKARALSELISLAESESLELGNIQEMISSHLGKTYVVGITGAPGSGKSTLINQLIGVIRKRGLSVGIIAVDPSSPITGGAVLGDRVRMQEHCLDEGVFIRSMGSRGCYGGLSGATKMAVDLLSAFGKDIVIVETVGVGQSEVGIAELANVVVLILVPGYGDEMQLVKAGIMEIADVIVVNKSDQKGADILLNALKSGVLSDRHQAHQTVLAVQAMNNVGIEELYDELERRRKSLTSFRVRTLRERYQS